ncbi:MAG TPA: MBL fold metallo-hydrolase [Gammaproteobacteria bacterium]|nr:MBL fold metallo-hydrolase [Gammaproteobacteria bacterium]
MKLSIKNAFQGAVLILTSNSIAAFASTEQDMQSHCENISLQVLGSGGPEINDGLASASFLLWIDGKARVMVDAGGGSSLNFEKARADFNDLKAILLTHLHVDHSAALPVYIKAGYFTGRSTALPVFGPASGGDFPATEDFIYALFNDRPPGVYAYLSDNIRQQASTDFLIEPQSVEPSGDIWRHQLTADIALSAINVVHGPVPALAWRVSYKGCSVSFSGDMNGRSGNLQKLAENTDLLVANNAIAQQAGRIAKNLHMTPQTIGKIASVAKVRKLALSHFMLRSRDKKSESVDIIKQNYEGEIILTDDLGIITFQGTP